MQPRFSQTMAAGDEFIMNEIEIVSLFLRCDFIATFYLTPLCVSGLGTRTALFSMLRYYRNHQARWPH